MHVCVQKSGADFYFVCCMLFEHGIAASNSNNNNNIIGQLQKNAYFCNNIVC